MNKYEIREEGHFIGVFDLNAAPTEIIRKLIEKAEKAGGYAIVYDCEGCQITASCRDWPWNARDGWWGPPVEFQSED